MQRKLKIPSFLALLFGGICLFIAVVFTVYVVPQFSGSSAEVLSLSGFTMGTSYQVQIANVPESLDQEVLATQIQSQLQRLDRGIFSTFSAESELSSFNRSPVNTEFSASFELLEVIAAAQRIYLQTEHNFDITISPLVDLWGFGPSGEIGSNTLPTQTQIDLAQSQLGNDAVTVSFINSNLSKSKAVQIDLSGIAKGYAVDQMAALLNSHGLYHFVMEIGGELKVSGYKNVETGRQESEPWTLAIEAPQNTQAQTHTSFSTEGKNFAVASSGDYRNYFDHDGQHYSHEINPVTGRPVTHNLASVTVIAATAAVADAYATALMVMGPEQGFRHASSNDLAAYFIMRTDSGFESRYTDSFRAFLQ